MKYRIDIISIHIGETINLKKQRIIKVLSEQEWSDEYEHYYNLTCLVEDEGNKPMKAILISVHAKWCALMMNGDKTVEVRKGTALYKAIQKLIDEYGYADIYVYCTMAKHIKDYLQIENGKYVCNVPKDYESELNGKVIFKFRCYKVEEIKYKPRELFSSAFYYVGLRNKIDFTFVTGDLLCKESCLTQDELDKYLNKKIGCAIHISDLEIFDKPKELGEFHKVGYEQSLKDALKEPPYPLSPYLIQKKYALTKAPQSWCYVEVEQ